ncbi:cysteine dioxygenase [Advenella sp. WQ 585]|uniref:Cysteine dioxygenase n=1 Tax=Advenella mandrilli TaxID=2800330 RepID=A0ABS1EEI3_9BURK|nr:cysteine dioxygenase [Advenella mandrilli]MBK1780207.1 cysteine dioxygenase [Advenella mandrilli]
MSQVRLLEAVKQLTRLVEKTGLKELDILEQAKLIMSDLVSKDDWLDESFAKPHPEYYQQYLLYGDPLNRFSLVSFVWAGGQQTPVHDHTVWGVIGMLRGAETERHFAFNENNILEATDKVATLKPGQVACVSPSIGDIHQVSNAFQDQTSISIHLYGGNIGRIQRHVFYPETAESKPFISGYSSHLTPNLWT